MLDLQARGVDAALAQSGGTLIASELDKLEVFKVISREDIRNMLSFEKDKQSLGCEADQACLAEIGGALGVEYIATVGFLVLTVAETGAVRSGRRRPGGAPSPHGSESTLLDQKFCSFAAGR
ncbi:MAG TPA: hypothetical protein VLW85_01320 [Myxococcales bacterium]|nr:hypothetical protein [Myxococcales bacterium]